MIPTASTARRPWVTGLLAVVILVPALVGFGKKFLEFLSLIGNEEGSFAVAPVLNYLLASMGFLLLFGWAVLHGMFRDIEQPKVDMLRREALLDELAAEEAEAREWED